MAKVLTIPDTLEAIDTVRESIAREAVRYGYDHDTVFAINLVLCEALANAYEHGNNEDPTKHITVRYLVDRRRMLIEITDEGDGFEPESIPDPTDPGRIGLARGRGIMLMKAYFDDVKYSRHGACVRLLKYNDTASRGREDRRGARSRNDGGDSEQNRSLDVFGR